MSTNKNIDTEGINDLLKQAFLNTDFNDPKNEKLLFAASQSALGGGRPFQPSSKNFVQKLSGTSKLVITLTTVALVSSGSWYYLKNKNAEPVQNTTIVPVIATHDSTGREETPDSKDAIIQEQKIPDKIKVAHTGNQVQRINDSTITKSPTVVYSKPLTSISYKAPVDPKIDTSYVFPKLTDKEIKDNEKQKIWMFDMVAKQNKSRYPLIPSGNYTYNGMQIPVQSFYMGCGMVTNLDYRTFLSDLLIHNRKSDFLIAKPD
ncbi:MAG TPA: hypothetical protein VK783_12195, partial [Bacteroidia bacterium]|nr:hypothetical protein [Bacteroidia bacterium]